MPGWGFGSFSFKLDHQYAMKSKLKNGKLIKNAFKNMILKLGIYVVKTVQYREKVLLLLEYINIE